METEKENEGKRISWAIIRSNSPVANPVAYLKCFVDITE